MEPRDRLQSICKHVTADPASRFSAHAGTRPAPLPPAAQRLLGKVAIVIGASSQVRDDISIGKATAIQFAREGAFVVCVARGEDGLQSVAESIRAEGGRCDTIACDATDSAQVKAMIDTVVARHGKVDVLHHNLGAGGGGGTVDCTEEAWEFGMKVNAFSPFICMKHVLPHMIAAGVGSIITTSSVMGSRHLIGRHNAPYRAWSGLNRLDKHAFPPAVALHARRFISRTNAVGHLMPQRCPKRRWNRSRTTPPRNLREDGH